jgi:hypothetical protein
MTSFPASFVPFITRMPDGRVRSENRWKCPLRRGYIIRPWRVAQRIPPAAAALRH